MSDKSMLYWYEGDVWNIIWNVQLLENPLPLPKKHEKRIMDFQVENLDEDDFDFEVSETDDFDIK